MIKVSHITVLALTALLAACASNGDRRSSDGRVNGIWGTPNPHVKVGKPYQVNGVWYEPKAEPDYDEVGLASWYGPGFHGRLTANGEVFDENRLTAAHPTLPLPSIVEVTNPRTGKRLKLRVNDRGPFANNRILDLSKEAARRLGTQRAGVAEVRVRYIGPARLDDAIIRLGEREEGQALYAAVGRPPSIKPYGATEPDTVVATAVLADVDDADIILADLDVSVLDDVRAPAITPASLPASQAVGGYFVQVGAFSSAANASAAAGRLPENNPVRLANIERGGRVLTLVRMGPFSHPLSAQQALEDARANGFPDALIVEEVVN